MTEQEHIVTIVRDPLAGSTQPAAVEATSQVSYHSAGHTLLIGPSERTLPIAALFQEHGVTLVDVDPQASTVQKRLTDQGVAVFTVPALSLSGYLGAFTAVARPRAAVLTSDAVQDDTTAPARMAEPLDLGVSVYRESGCFDLVFDCSDQPVLSMALPPFGYQFAAPSLFDDMASVKASAAELLELRGEFEKPRYFRYDASVCAHSRSELSGCNRCMTACATDAISTDGEGIQVNPYLCQGCGSCATTCPSGALTYAWPRPSDAIEKTRQTMLSTGASVLLLHSESQAECVEQAGLPEDVLTLLVEEVTAFGADYWLALLAGPASRIVMLDDSADDDPGRHAVRQQIDIVHALMETLGVTESVIHTVNSDALPQAVQAGSLLAPCTLLSQHEPQLFATHNDKRQTIRMALDALHDALTVSAQETPEKTMLPAGAPFGVVHVDQSACTLCMACVSTCPAKALLDGQDQPALRFIEANCLQCGLCESACPESAISLEARYTWDSTEARRIETLHEEEPFHCLMCHTPFTTRAMIDTMVTKLSGHWMFKDDKAVRRLKLCGDCRVRDMFSDSDEGIDVHSPPDRPSSH